MCLLITTALVSLLFSTKAVISDSMETIEVLAGAALFAVSATARVSWSFAVEQYGAWLPLACTVRGWSIEFCHANTGEMGILWGVDSARLVVCTQPSHRWLLRRIGHCSWSAALVMVRRRSVYNVYDENLQMCSTWECAVVAIKWGSLRGFAAASKTRDESLQHSSGCSAVKGNSFQMIRISLIHQGNIAAQVFKIKMLRNSWMEFKQLWHYEMEDTKIISH